MADKGTSSIRGLSTVEMALINHTAGDSTRRQIDALFVLRFPWGGRTYDIASAFGGEILSQKWR